MKTPPPMKTKNGYCITHDYCGSQPSIVSTHRTLSGAEAQLARSRASFRVGYPNTGSVRAIFPLSIRRLIDGEAAAAPDLLAAEPDLLAVVQALVDAGGIMEPSEWFTKARAAIAKATPPAN